MGRVQTNALNNFILDLSSGMSIRKAIERLELTEDDVPALLWKQTLAVDACRRLGPERCSWRIFTVTDTVFVRQDETFQMEGRKELVPAYILGARLCKSEFDDIHDFVRRIARANYPLTRYKREVLLQLMFTEAEAMLREPGPGYKNVRDYLLRGANLPIRTNSPLLQYDSEELAAEDRPLCEIDALIDWARQVDGILNIVKEGTYRPEFDPVDRAPDLICPRGRYDESACSGITVLKNLLKSTYR